MDLEHLKEWTGRTEQQVELIGAKPLDALNALLDRDDPPAGPGDAVPPLWHWLYFLPVVRSSQVGPDGHPLRGGFLPPVPLPRRMIAGGRLQFTGALRVGDSVTRHAAILKVEHKQGRTGDLVFVTVRNEFTTPRGTVLVEEQDIVYREAPQADASQAPAPATAAQIAPTSQRWQREFTPDEVILFKFSALTFNGHRIHYDHPYATQVEGYPGLVVHGPLIAILLADLLRRSGPRRPLKHFTYRALSPVFHNAPFFLCADPAGADGAAAWAKSAEGRLAMRVEATFG